MWRTMSNTMISDCKNTCNSGCPLCVILDSAQKGTKRLIVVHEAKLHPRLTDLLKCVVAFPSADLSHYLLTVHWIWFLQL